MHRINLTKVVRDLSAHNYKTQIKATEDDSKFDSYPVLRGVGAGLPWWLSGKESACSAEAMGSILVSGRPPGGGHDNPLQYS